MGNYIQHNLSVQMNLEQEITQQVMKRSTKNLAQLYKLLLKIKANKILLEELAPIYLEKVNDEIKIKESTQNKIQSVKSFNTNKMFFGKSNSWKQYVGGIKGIYMEIDIRQFDLSKAPFVNIFISGISSMWELTATGIYQLSNEGFKVYVRCCSGNQVATLSNAQKHAWYLNYQIISLD